MGHTFESFDYRLQKHLNKIRNNTLEFTCELFFLKYCKQYECMDVDTST